MSSGLVELTRIGDLGYAELVKETLLAEGIHAIIQGGHTSSMFAGALGTGCLGAHPLLVPALELERARELLEAIEERQAAPVEGVGQPPAIDVSNLLAEDDRICGQCGSDLVYLSEESRVGFIDILLLGIPLFYRKKEYVCRSCGAPWTGA